MDENKIWTRHDPATDKTFVATARRDWIDAKFIQRSLASEDIYWAVPMSDEAINTMLDHSLTFCLYVMEDSAGEPSPRNLNQIGMARVVTDRVTYAYLTDVFVLPEHQGGGLGNWLIGCLMETVESMRVHGAFRRVTLLTARGSRTEKYYKRILEMEAGEDIPDLVFLTTKFRI